MDKGATQEGTLTPAERHSPSSPHSCARRVPSQLKIRAAGKILTICDGFTR